MAEAPSTPECAVRGCTMGSALLYGESFAAAGERVKKIIGKSKKKEGIDYEEVADF